MNTHQSQAGADSAFGAVARTRMRDRFSTVDQVMTVVAAVLLPLGLAMVFLGWYGASHTPYLFEQVPYLVSGGLLGLGLVLTGGFVFFGSWIARTAREQRALDLQLLDAVREVRDELARLPGPDPATAPAPRSSRKSGSVVSNGTSGLVATARGSMLHRPDCAIVSDREDVHDVSAADAEGMQPCRLCDPLGVGARTRA